MRSSNIFDRILNYIDLDSDLDNYDKIHETIKKELIFKGTNLWILAFAIIVASVGLNMNSTAVIIGAMLISPLMGPINGMGYSIATYDFQLFMQSLKNFSFAVAASLIASTAYFLISPISTAHSELLARTSPTIYDVLIALFGGLAGIVAISSKYKGNVIPGVAIATALMPPLFTARYGFSTLQYTYLFGALYLFIINTVFIAISSVIISQILKFPITTLVDAGQKKKVNQVISFVIILVLIPSIYFGYLLVQKEKFSSKATQYVNTVNITDGNYLLKNIIDPDNKTITLIYGGTSLTDDQKINIIDKTKDFSLNDVEIIFKQGLSLDPIMRKTTEVESLTAEINRLMLLLNEKNKQTEAMSEKNYLGKQLLDEIKVLYPEFINCSYSESFLYSDSISNPEPIAIVVLKSEKNNIGQTSQKKITDWLKQRLKPKRIKVLFDS